MSKISTNEIAAVIIQELYNYTDDLKKDIKRKTREVAKWAKKEVAEKSPVKTTEYSKNWGMRTKVGDNYISIRVRQRKKPQLTHLLEYGHLTRNHKDKAKAIPHIEKVQQQATAELDNEIFKLFK